jgi:hypothetical protein
MNALHVGDCINQYRHPTTLNLPTFSTVDCDTDTARLRFLGPMSQDQCRAATDLHYAVESNADGAVYCLELILRPGLCIPASVHGVNGVKWRDVGVSWRPVDCDEAVDSSIAPTLQDGAEVGKLRIVSIVPDDGVPSCDDYYTKKSWQSPPMRVCVHIV